MCSTTWSETAWSASAMSHAVWRASSCASTQQLSLRLGGFRCFLDGHGLDSTPADHNLRCDSAAPSKGSYTADRQTESVKAQPYQRRPTFHLTEIGGLTYFRKSQHQIGTRILRNACGGEKPRTRAEGVRYNAANYVLHRHTAPAQCPVARIRFGSSPASATTILWRRVGIDKALPRATSRRTSRTRVLASSQRSTGTPSFETFIRSWNSICTNPGATAVTVMPRRR